MHGQQPQPSNHPCTLSSCTWHPQVFTSGTDELLELYKATHELCTHLGMSSYQGQAPKVRRGARRPAAVAGSARAWSEPRQQQ